MAFRSAHARAGESAHGDQCPTLTLFVALPDCYIAVTNLVTDQAGSAIRLRANDEMLDTDEVSDTNRRTITWLVWQPSPWYRLRSPYRRAA